MDVQVTTDDTAAAEAELKIRIDEQIEKNNGIIPDSIIVLGENQQTTECRLGNDRLFSLITDNLVIDEHYVIPYFHYTYGYDLR